MQLHSQLMWKCADILESTASNIVKNSPHLHRHKIKRPQVLVEHVVYRKKVMKMTHCSRTIWMLDFKSLNHFSNNSILRKRSWKLKRNSPVTLKLLAALCKNARGRERSWAIRMGALDWLQKQNNALSIPFTQQSQNEKDNPVSRSKAPSRQIMAEMIQTFSQNISFEGLRIDVAKDATSFYNSIVQFDHVFSSAFMNMSWCRIQPIII